MDTKSPIINTSKINTNIFINVLTPLHNKLHNSIHYGHIECGIVLEHNGNIVAKIPITETIANSERQKVNQ
ncbi:MAG TPA: hypothetical protein PLQ70_08735 [Flavobacterium alvei]|nr:hypothetical protein [Flavobacterium alvei]